MLRIVTGNKVKNCKHIKPSNYMIFATKSPTGTIYNGHKEYK